MLPDVTDSQLNPLPASGEFCRLLMIFLKEFFKKVYFEKKKKKKMTKNMEKYQARSFEQISFSLFH